MGRKTRQRRSTTFDTREQAEQWLLRMRVRADELTVAELDRFTDHELARILTAARDEHFHPVILALARTGLRAGEACGLRWRDLNLTGPRPRLSVVWQLDKWGGLVRPKSPSVRRTLPLRPEVVEVLEGWRARQDVWADRLGEEWGNEHDLAFTTRTGGPVWARNVGRVSIRARHRRSSVTPT